MVSNLHYFPLMMVPVDKYCSGGWSHQPETFMQWYWVGMTCIPLLYENPCQPTTPKTYIYIYIIIIIYIIIMYVYIYILLLYIIYITYYILYYHIYIYILIYSIYIYILYISIYQVAFSLPGIITWCNTVNPKGLFNDCLYYRFMVFYDTHKLFEIES